MRNLISKFRFERLRKLLGSGATDQGTKSARAELLEVQEAVALTEAMICDAIALCPGDEAAEVQSGGNGFASTNVFGRQVVSVGLPSVAESIAAGAGMAMSGLRSAVFLPGDHLSEGYAQLQSIAHRHVPLIVHAAFREGFGPGSNHAGYHGAGELGMFQAMPHSVQQAIDLTVLCRWVAERSLLPGLLAFDRRVAEMAAFPAVETLRAFLGDPDQMLPSPNPAQLLLFGSERPGVPAWFDADRPVAFGSLQGTNDAASATVGRQAFFMRHFPSLLEEGLERLSNLTGRKLSMVETDAAEKADLVLVTQGSSYETACAAARYLRQERGLAVGVLGVTWLRPFPSQAIEEAVRGKRGIAVLECSGAALTEEGSLMREVRRAAGSHSGHWLSARFGLHGQPLSAAQVIDLVSEFKEKKPRSKVWLGIVTGAAMIGDFPKRESLLKAVASDYPELIQNTISEHADEKLTSPSLKTVQWVGSSSFDTAEVIRKIADSCADATGPKVRGFGYFPEPGVLSVRVSMGASELPIAEAGTGVDVLLLSRHSLDLIHNPLADLRSRQAVILETDRNPREVWQLLPEFWRSEIRRLKLRLFKSEEGFEQLAAGAGALISEAVDVPFSEIAWSDLEDPVDDLDEVPSLVRRAGDATSSYSNLARFWGEVMQPKRGGISDNFPDPLVTVGAVPPYTAALARPRGTALPSMPVLDPSKCTGCGHCWPVCPDSAIGATLIGIQEFLDAAAAQTGVEGKTAGALKRAHRPIAARVAALLKQRDLNTVSLDVWMESFESVIGKMGVSDEELPEYREAFRATAEVANRLSPVACELLFGKPESSVKGSGQLLVLAFNPDACQGCSLCITSCPEAALGTFERAGSVKQDARQGWKLWEQLPDTPGAVIEKVESELELGQLAARFLSRFSSQVQAVGSFGDPGSGERLACRIITGVVESQVQDAMADQTREATELATQLRGLVQTQLAKGLTDADPKTIQTALESLPRHRVTLSELSERLSTLGRAVVLDPVRTLRLAQTAHDLESEAWCLSEGPNKLGRSRFGVVIVSHRIARWAGRFPNHPYNAPLVVEPSPEGAGLAIGLAEATALKHVEQARRYRRGRLYLENPPDLPGKLVELDDLTWSGLTETEKATCPPLLVFADESALTRQGLGALSRLLTRGLPIKLVLLDARTLNLQSSEPALFGLGFPGAFVLSGSLGALTHLADNLVKAIRHSGPAVVHLHVPIPREQGFEPVKTLERARVAVQARVQPLFRFDPRAAGVFGEKISLDGNPAPDTDWAGADPISWAFAEGRFKKLFQPLPAEASPSSWKEYLILAPEERQGLSPVFEDSEGNRWLTSPELVEFADHRLSIWKTYQEVGGLVSPFVDRVRSAVEKEITSAKQSEFKTIKAEYEERISRLEHEADSRLTSQLRDRLLALAGFGSSKPHTDKSE